MPFAIISVNKKNKYSKFDIHFNLIFSYLESKSVFRIREIKKSISTSMKQALTCIWHPYNVLALREKRLFYLPSTGI